ncbi:helix-turn-helix domain-containing protein [Nocardia sp. NPDC058497]|uniref:helix-turn-helix domain-containing protein n=1 Tax=Nocardia sp. NPDC058497 TaxID=3346529 RepID=UPI00365D556D
MRPIMSERELAGWEVAEPSAPLIDGVTMGGFRDRVAGGADMQVVARPEVTVVIQFGESGLAVGNPFGQNSFGGVVAGLSPGPRRVGTQRFECLEVRLSPIAAYRLLGGVPGDLRDTVADIGDVWGPAATLLRERLAETATWAGRFAVTTRFLTDRASTRSADPEVTACWYRIVASNGDVRVRDLAEFTGWSRKRVWSRFTTQVGVTPKRAAMVVRFRSAFDLLVTGHSPADVAVACGYSDQSHLHRDVSAFAGITPGALAST